jgi:hypothetical protein
MHLTTIFNPMQLHYPSCVVAHSPRDGHGTPGACTTLPCCCAAPSNKQALALPPLLLSALRLTGRSPLQPCVAMSTACSLLSSRSSPTA